MKLADRDAAIEAKLDQHIQMDYDGEPLVAIVNYIATKIDAEIVVVQPFEADTVPITLHARSISARTALELLLESANYDYLVRDGAIFILPLDRAMHCRVYDCRALLAAVAKAKARAQPHGAMGPPDSDLLVEIVTQAIEPESWTFDGTGPATARMIGGLLVVRHRAKVHREVQGLLELLATTLGSEAL